MDTAVSVELFVEILNRYVYYFEQQNEAVRKILVFLSQKRAPLEAHNLMNEQVTTKYLNGLIELIHSNLQTNQESATIDNPKRHFQRTLDYIASREYEGVVVSAAKWCLTDRRIGEF